MSLKGKLRSLVPFKASTHDLGRTLLDTPEGGVILLRIGRLVLMWATR